MAEWSLIGTAFVLVLGLFVRYEVVMDHYWTLRLAQRKRYRFWKAMFQFWKSPEEFNV